MAMGDTGAAAGQPTDDRKEELSLDTLLQSGQEQPILEQARPFLQLMMEYDCAILEMRTKLDVLNSELSLRNSRNPFESIKCRRKTPQSILDKLRRRGLPFTVESIEKNLNDVAGIRVICSFVDDIYVLAENLMEQDDITVLAVKDYIAHPKPNGYRSLHLILDVPIFLSDEKKHMRVEVQFRTIAMDFWASLEHKLKYKKDVQEPEAISAELRACAQEINALDIHMQQIRKRIESQTPHTPAQDEPDPVQVFLPESLKNVSVPEDG